MFNVTEHVQLSSSKTIKYICKYTSLHWNDVNGTHVSAYVRL
jgi:hypothetical protein